MSPEIAALVGAAIGSAGTLVVTVIAIKADERKHHRSLIYQSGIENFKEACEMARRSGGGVAPIEDYIINAAKIAALLSKGADFSEKELVRMMKESNQIANKLSELRLEFEKSRGQT